jgi:hypothetical protein
MFQSVWIIYLAGGRLYVLCPWDIAAKMCLYKISGSRSSSDDDVVLGFDAV